MKLRKKPKTEPKHDFELNIDSVEPIFNGWLASDYADAGIKYIEPMLAKELDEAKQQEVFDNPNDYYIEEKFDGTRGVLHIFKDSMRCFSRRVSKKSGWLTENSDNLPHIRDLKVPFLDGTILDGELFVPDKPFKDVASIMNCLPEEAIKRQRELGWVVFHAFDILYYRGMRVERMPLEKRKAYLKRAIDHINAAYPNNPIREVTCYSDGIVALPCELLWEVESICGSSGKYPELEKCLQLCSGDYDTVVLGLSYKAYYEYVVAKGGEGVIIKPKDGRYYHKRGWEYSKIKKFLTKDVVILGFTKPTHEYEGKFPNPRQWNYWQLDGGEMLDTSNPKNLKTVEQAIERGLGVAPITRYAYMNWVGNIRYGVVITPEEIKQLPKDKHFDIVHILDGDGNPCSCVEVGECSGFDDDMRAWFTEHYTELVGSVIEVKANEMFKDTGKLRHPRFFRLRADKSATDCTWKNHIGE